MASGDILGVLSIRCRPGAVCAQLLSPPTTRSVRLFSSREEEEYGGDGSASVYHCRVSIRHVAHGVDGGEVEVGICCSSGRLSWGSGIVPREDSWRTDEYIGDSVDFDH